MMCRCHQLHVCQAILQDDIINKKMLLADPHSIAIALTGAGSGTPPAHALEFYSVAFTLKLENLGAPAVDS